jgi:hypothetical protein
MSPWYVERVHRSVDARGALDCSSPPRLTFTRTTERAWRNLTDAPDVVGGAVLAATTVSAWTLSDLVVDQSLSKAHNVVGRVAESFIESDDVGVARTNLEIDLGTAVSEESRFRCPHQKPADSLSPKGRGNSKVVDPAAMPIVARHHRPDDGVSGRGYKEQVRLDLLLALDVPARVVPRAE